MQEITEAVRSFILNEFLPGENPEELKDDTPLISGGILDSVATLKLVSFLEDRFKITVEAHEVDIENLNTVADIRRLVQQKAQSARA